MDALFFVAGMHIERACIPLNYKSIARVTDTPARFGQRDTSHDR